MMINFFKKILNKDKIEERRSIISFKEMTKGNVSKIIPELGDVHLVSYEHFGERITCVYYFDKEEDRNREIEAPYDFIEDKEKYIDECIVELIKGKKIRSDRLAKLTKLPDLTKMPIVSMINHDGILVVATTNRVYQLTSDNILVPIKFKMG